MRHLLQRGVIAAAAFRICSATVAGNRAAATCKSALSGVADTEDVGDAIAGHPLEAIVEAGIFAIFLFTIPIHPLHLFIFFLLMILYNVYGHLGFELYPKGFNRHFIGRWINTSVNHNLHHQYFKGNYGLYFTFWDRMMGTIRKDYDQKFEEVKNREKPTPSMPLQTQAS